jgi:hypothetical protein
VLLDQRWRNPVRIRCVLDEPAEALGCRSHGRIAEGRRLPLDVMGGAEQSLFVRVGESAAQDVAARAVEPLALLIHPAAEFR